MIIGHRNQWNFLVKAAELDRLSHAYLFYGQERLGKKTLAVEFVKYLNCEKVIFSKPRARAGLAAEPCQICRNCRDIQKRAHPDFILIEPKRKEIQISQIRDLIWKISLRPYSAVFKVAILDKAHLMTKEAQNCFLKLLEEPKGKALLILISEYPEILLPTILSRVQKLRFSLVRSTEIENYLIEKGISGEKAKYLSQLSLGEPGAAINFLSDPQKLEEQKKLISDLIQINNADLAFRFQYAKKLSEKSFDVSKNSIKEVLDIWLRYLRSIFLSRLGKQVKVKDFNQYSLPKLGKIIKLLQSINFLLATTNINSRLALEILLLEL